MLSVASALRHSGSITDFPPAQHSSAHSSDALQAAYLHAVEAVKAKYHIPGVVVGISNRKGDTWHAALGLSDVETGAPVSIDQHFSIRSVTKSYTVTLILELAREKQLSLDDPISKYYPGIPNGNSITLTQLAAMESGIESYTRVDEFLEPFIADTQRQWDPNELIELSLPKSPLFSPGAKYDYSNTNTLLLGAVAEKVTKLSLAQAFQQYIFDPLNLEETSYPDSNAFPSPHPKSYLVDPKDGKVKEAPPVNFSSFGASGGIVTTIDDFLNWGKALGTGSLIGNKLQALRERHSRRADKGPEYDRYGLGMGELLGWWGHTGEGLGYQAATFYDKRSKTTIAVMVNSSQPVNVATQVFKALANVIQPKGIPGKAHHFSSTPITPIDSDGLLE